MRRGQFQLWHHLGLGTRHGIYIHVPRANPTELWYFADLQRVEKHSSCIEAKSENNCQRNVV